MVAVIFISQRTHVDENYSEINDKLEALAAKLSGFIKVESCRDKDGYGISISYWKTMEDAVNWKEVPYHKIAQEAGKDKWYESYSVDVCEVKRSYSFKK